MTSYLNDLIPVWYLYSTLNRTFIHFIKKKKNNFNKVTLQWDAYDEKLL